MKRSKKEKELIARLDEFRGLAKVYHTEPAVRKQFADILYKVFTEFNNVKFLYVVPEPKRMAAMAELKKYAAEYPKDAIIQIRLLNTIQEAVSKAAEYELLHDDIRYARKIAKRLPNTIRVREAYTEILKAAFLAPAVQDNRGAYFTVLDELRNFAEKHYIDEFTWNEFANQLANVNIDNRFKDNMIQRDKMLIELRVLSDRYPSYKKVRAALAFALAHADKEENLMRRDAMIHELRSLIKRHPQDEVIFEHFLMTLSTTIQKEKSINRQDMLIEIFRDLCAKSPELRPREVFAHALIYAIGDAEKNNYQIRRDRLLAEFNQLSEKHPHRIKLKEVIRHSGLDLAQFDFILNSTDFSGTQGVEAAS